ncbi:MAG: sulfite exporter TauE/SafE family protein [Bacteroidota bacterium]
MDLLPAFMIGLLGSLHCVGMCGPLALALPIGVSSTSSFLIGRALYNLGRVATYAFMGVLAGLIGQKIVFYGFQQTVSIIAGALMIGAFAFPTLIGSRLARLSFLEGIGSSVQKAFSSLLQRRSVLTMFLIGIVNGLLPCGLVYVALAGSAMTGDPIEGALFATMFGLGTFPMMFVVSVIGKRVTPSVRQRIARVVPVFMIVLGTLFILRGMNLGIPMVSPKVGSGATMQRGEHQH